MKNLILFLSVFFIFSTSLLSQKQSLYTESGIENPTFEELKIADSRTCINKKFEGSTININNKIIENRGLNSLTPVPKNIKLHVLCNPSVGYSKFNLYKRWYQENKNTQIFRLYKGEKNTRNSRLNAARSEVFGYLLKWKNGDGWHEWTGRFTIPDKGAQATIFQVKNDTNDWSVMLGFNRKDNGTLVLNHRIAEDIIIDTNLIGKSFDIKVRDDGYNYEVYYNNKLVGSNYFKRPQGTSTFRWGMYVGNNEVVEDAMIFVSNIKFYKSNDKINNLNISSSKTNSIENSHFIIYPNPTKDFLSVKGDISLIYLIEVYSLSGKKILSKSKDFDKINISNLEKAGYFVKIITNNSSETIKILKN